MFIHYIDDEISLKLLEHRDAQRIFKLTNDSRDYLREWLPWVDGTTELEDTLSFIKMTLKEFAETRGLTTAILYKGEIVGVAGYNSINRLNNTAYIGYWLGEGFQGHGIMTRVARALITYAFDELGLHKVEIRAAVKNEKSRGIPERLGLINEGRIRQAEWIYDHYVDHVIYGILAEEWVTTPPAL